MCLLKRRHLRRRKWKGSGSGPQLWNRPPRFASHPARRQSGGGRAGVHQRRFTFQCQGWRGCRCLCRILSRSFCQMRCSPMPWRSLRCRRLLDFAAECSHHGCICYGSLAFWFTRIQIAVESSSSWPGLLECCNHESVTDGHRFWPCLASWNISRTSCLGDVRELFSKVLPAHRSKHATCRARRSTQKSCRWGSSVRHRLIRASRLCRC